MEVGKKRSECIREEKKKNAKLGDKAFDEAVRGALRDQAGKKGFTIPDWIPAMTSLHRRPRQRMRPGPSWEGPGLVV
jgi:hypothetical protein